MANLDARVGQLEGRMLEQSEGIADIRDGVARLDAKLTVLAAVVGGLLSE